MSKTLDDDDKKLYDRQIRLFGYDTQEKIKNLNVQILCGKKEYNTTNNECLKISYVAGEILKNFALLGVIDFEICETTYNSFLEIVPSSLTDINKNIIYNIVKNNENCEYNSDVENKTFLRIFVDCNMTTNGYFICSNCFSFSNKYHENCKKRNEDVVIFGCLLGACFVQEIIKMIMGEKYCNEFILEL